jgi:hypothetical protein
MRKKAAHERLSEKVIVMLTPNLMRWVDARCDYEQRTRSAIVRRALAYQQRAQQRGEGRERQRDSAEEAAA